MRSRPQVEGAQAEEKAERVDSDAEGREVCWEGLWQRSSEGLHFLSEAEARSSAEAEGGRICSRFGK